MERRGPAAVVFPLAMAAASIAWLPAADLPPEVLKLAAIRRHMAPELKRTMGMTCLETIERSRWDGKGKLTQTDRLQLEVGFAGSRELFAWPGDDYFSTETPADLAGAGLGSSGELVAHLNSVFNAPGASIRPRQPSAAADGRLLRYEFEVPQFGSAFTVAGLTGSATVGSYGSFWADPDTLDIVRIENRARDIPVQTSLSEVIQSVDYARVILGGGVARLAPQRALTTAVHLDRSVHRNRIEFSHCREFGASSQVSFTGGVPATPEPPIAVPGGIKTRLPARIGFRVRLDGGLELAAAHAGQPVTAVLVDAIKHRGRQLAAAGAKVTGRLRWLEQRKEEQQDGHGRWMIGLEFTTLATEDGGAIRFLATLNAIQDPGGAARLYTPGRKRELIAVGHRRLGDLAAIEEFRQEETIELLRLPGVGLFTLPASTTRVPAGFELTWMTE